MDLTLRRELWWINSIFDGLGNFFKCHFQVVGCVDVEPVKLLPTWVNNIASVDVFAKRLEIFLVHEDILQRIDKN